MYELMPDSQSAQAQWENAFSLNILQSLARLHPGLGIDHDAVEHIRRIISKVILDLLDLKCQNTKELHDNAVKYFSRSCSTIPSSVWDALPAWKYKKELKNLRQNTVAFIKEASHYRGVERKSREYEKELFNMSLYLVIMSEFIAEDMLLMSGNFVKNIKNNGEIKITLANLKIALRADRELNELIKPTLHDHEEENNFMSPFPDFVLNSDDEQSSAETYASITRNFLNEERQFLRELNRAYIFKRRIDETLKEEDREVMSWLFSNLLDIHELATKMERVLEDGLVMSEPRAVGIGLWELCEAKEFDCFISYIKRDVGDPPEELDLTRTIPSAITVLLDREKSSKGKTREEIMDKNASYSILSGNTYRSALRYLLPAFLYAPLVHVCRYAEFTSKLLRVCQSPEDKVDLRNCNQYLTRVVKYIEQTFSRLHDPSLLHSLILSDSRMRNESLGAVVSKRQEIEKSIDGFAGEPIGKSCKELVEDGELRMVRPSFGYSPDIPLRGEKWATSRQVYIFDQLVILCKKYKGDKRDHAKFKDRCPANSIQVEDLTDSNVINSFRIKFSQEQKRSYLFFCKTPEEKSIWMAALLRVSTSNLVERVLTEHEKEENRRIPLILPTPEQYKFAEPDSDENISFEDYTSSSGVPVIKCGTVLKLVERLTYPYYVDTKFVQSFLISYQSFCSPTELLSLLIDRFNIPIPAKLQQPDMKGGPLAGRYDTVQSHGLSNSTYISSYYEKSYQRFRREYERPVHRRVLVVLMQWVKNHWYDFTNDAALLETLRRFLKKVCDTPGQCTNQNKNHCKNILNYIDKMVCRSPTIGHTNTAFDFGTEATNELTAKDANTFQSSSPEILWHAAKKGDIANYDLLTLHPIEVGRQLTLLHFDMYRSIKPIELVSAAWTKHDKYEKSPQLLKLTDHSTKLSYWVSRSILETDSVEERLALFSRVLEIMAVFEDLNNFAGLVAFHSALLMSSVHRLRSSWERLDHDKKNLYSRFEKLNDARWNILQKNLKSIDPPCVPFFGHYLSNIYFLETGKQTFVTQNPILSHDTDGINSKKVLVSFVKCRRLSEIIRDIQMYQNQPYWFQKEPSIRQFFESINPKSDFNDDDNDLETYLYERSMKIEPRDSDKLPDAKPRYAPAVLRSPGYKHAKGNPTASSSAASNHASSVSPSTQSSTVPSTPNFDDNGSHFATNFDDSNQTRGSTPADFFSRSNHSSTSPLIPPVLPPRISKTHGSMSSTSSPPPIFPRTRRTPSATSPRSPRGPKSASHVDAPSFVFPVAGSTLPTSLCRTVGSDEGPLGLTIDAHTPTVSLSLPPPPPRPPRRPVPTESPPPPLPPKSTSSGSPAPPPLPPKTYTLHRNGSTQS